MVSDSAKEDGFLLKIEMTKYKVAPQMSMMTVGSSNYLAKSVMKESTVGILILCFPKNYYLLLMSILSPTIPVSLSVLNS